jgi:hypothetical protein
VSFDWNDYLRLAEELCESPRVSEEASNRSATSRAYYATFHLTAQTLERLKIWGRAHSASDHKEIRDFLQRYGSQVKGKAGADLARLYILRGRADYEDELPNSSADAQLSLTLARKIVAQLPKF